MLAGQAGEDARLIETPSPNFDARMLPVTMIVLHYTGMPDAAGAVARLTDPEAITNWPQTLGRDGARALRKRWLVEALMDGRKHGTYWGVSTAIRDYGLTDTLVSDTPITDALDAVKTRLNGFEPELQGRLINWGYALADAALRRHVDPSMARADGLPLPQWPLQ